MPLTPCIERHAVTDRPIPQDGTPVLVWLGPIPVHVIAWRTDQPSHVHGVGLWECVGSGAKLPAGGRASKLWTHWSLIALGTVGWPDSDENGA